MVRKERHAYVEAVRPRYCQGNRGEKKRILDEMVLTLGMHRKAVIRMLSPRPRAEPTARAAARRPQGRPASLTESDQARVRRLWDHCDYACGKRLRDMLPEWVDFDEALYQDYEPGQKARLLSLSAASLARYLRPVRRSLGIRGRTGTKPGSLLREHIPIRSGPWEVASPGFLEADTVAHCGHSMKGAFVWSLTVTDIHTGWTECRALWNKSIHGVIESLQDIDAQLPFTIKAFDCDNGGEFLNHTLVRYFQEHPAKPAFTRSRPYQKNDNAHVEQKNWTHVRQLFAYTRIEQRDLIPCMNELYRNEVSWMMNFFTPTMKLKEKVRIGSRIVKRYEKAKTPLQRILQDPDISSDTKEQLIFLRNQLNPILLRRHIRATSKQILQQASVTQISEATTHHFGNHSF